VSVIVTVTENVFPASVLVGVIVISPVVALYQERAGDKDIVTV
jgi:hypothetical protein